VGITHVVYRRRTPARFSFICLMYRQAWLGSPDIGPGRIRGNSRAYAFGSTRTGLANATPRYSIPSNHLGMKPTVRIGMVVLTPYFESSPMAPSVWGE
jgi:hypothetical protein